MLDEDRLSVFVNKISLESSYFYSFMYYLWLLSCYSSKVEGRVATQTVCHRNIYCLTKQKKGASSDPHRGKTT